MIILRNLVENTNKYTKHGQIDIEVSIVAKRVTIAIADTGTGFRPAILEKLNNVITRPLGNYSREEELGYGYQFITDFCKLLNLKIEIESGGNGTKLLLQNIFASEEKDSDVTNPNTLPVDLPLT
ncbi:ATP-binding protein [Flavitalea antarctica]